MQEVDYDGWFAIEYVWVDWEGCNRTENTCETIRFRDLARKVIAGEEYVAPVKTL
jgi:hypothetical protein